MSEKILTSNERDVAEFLVRAAQRAGFNPRQWQAMFYDVGPYEVTCPTVEIKRFAEFILQGKISANSSAPETSPHDPLRSFAEWAAGASCDDEYAPRAVKHIAAMAKDALSGNADISGYPNWKRSAQETYTNEAPAHPPILPERFNTQSLPENGKGDGA